MATNRPKADLSFEAMVQIGPPFSEYESPALRAQVFCELVGWFIATMNEEQLPTLIKNIQRTDIVEKAYDDFMKHGDADQTVNCFLLDLLEE